MDINFINITKENLLYYHLYPRLYREEKSFVVTANPEIVMKTKEDEAYKAIVHEADFVVPDGAGIVFASKIMRNSVKERIPGFDLMVDLLEFAEQKGLSCYFLGAIEEVNDKLIIELEKKYPNLRIAGHHHGYFLEEQIIGEQVAATDPDIIFVALGLPKQEEWISRHKDKFTKGLFMGVGGSFDVLAGEVKRAPKKWINFNLEWLYRFLRQPFRWKRLLKSLAFIIRILFNRQ